MYVIMGQYPKYVKNSCEFNSAKKKSNLKTRRGSEWTFFPNKTLRWRNITYMWNLLKKIHKYRDQIGGVQKVRVWGKWAK